MKNTKCHICGSEDFKAREVECIYRRNGKYLIVRDMPCEVCLRCGERYYPAEALLAVEARFKAIYEKQREPEKALIVPVESFANERQKTYDVCELVLINQNADRLNHEAGDVLTYQMGL